MAGMCHRGSLHRLHGQDSSCLTVRLPGVFDGLQIVQLDSLQAFGNTLGLGVCGDWLNASVFITYHTCIIHIV